MNKEIIKNRQNLLCDESAYSKPAIQVYEIEMEDVVLTLSGGEGGTTPFDECDDSMFDN
jgi:hypothetical protein